MAFHLENHGLPVADIDDARIFARPLDDLRPLRRQLLQPDARGFIGAMLGPHHRDDAQLGQIRRAAQLFASQAELGRRHAVRRGHLFGGDSHLGTLIRHREAAPAAVAIQSSTSASLAMTVILFIAVLGPESAISKTVTPLTLSLSPWERGRPNNGRERTPSPMGRGLG